MGGIGQVFFFCVMGAAAALTLLRSYAFAAVMKPEDFGQYASVIATGAFCGALLSFGLVEKSLKAFPKLFIEGRISALIGLSRDMEKHLFMRVVVLIPIALLVWLVFPQISLAEYLIIPVVAGLVATCSAGASMLRAGHTPTPLAVATLLRALIALAAGAAGAIIWSAAGAIGGEIIGAAAFLILVALHRSKMRLSCKTSDASEQQLSAQEHLLQEWEGKILYFAGLCSAAPIYLDRLVVRLGADDATSLGTYSLLATLSLAASAFVGIVAQVVGPRLIHMSAQDVSGEGRRRYIAKTVMLCVVVMLTGFVIGAWLVIDGPFSAFGASYALTWPLAALAVVLACGQVTVLLDWFLISTNRETSVLSSAALFLLASFVAFLIFVVAKASITVLLSLLGLAKLLQIVSQIAFAWCPQVNRQQVR
ncbi:MAG: hypothetical protein ACRC6I_06000 [Paracoccaceae bacterium]